MVRCKQMPEITDRYICDKCHNVSTFVKIENENDKLKLLRK